jgi:hypothetical protein
MRKTLWMAACAVLVGTVTASAGTLTLAIEADEGGGSWVSSITVAPDATVDVRITGDLTTADGNKGLALFGVTLVSGGAAPMNLSEDVGGGVRRLDLVRPLSADMQNFDRNLGLTNPPGPTDTGYRGTPSGNDLLQVGGGQNTINNITAPYPTGPIALWVGHAGHTQTLAEFTLTAPSDAGTYTIALDGGFANQLDTENQPTSVTPATIDDDSTLTIIVGGDTVPPEFAAVEPVKSWKNHNTVAAPNWLYIAFPPAATAQNVGVETRLYANTNYELELTVAFNEPVQVPALLTDIVMCGCAHGPYNPSSVVLDPADPTNQTLRMIFNSVPNGQVGIEDREADRYQLYLGEVQDIAGNYMKDGSDDDVEFIAQVGNVNESGPPVATRNVTNATDRGEVVTHYQFKPANPGATVDQANAKYDIQYFGPPAATRNAVNATDRGVVVSHYTNPANPGTPNNAVCAAFSPAGACPSPPW